MSSKPIKSIRECADKICGLTSFGQALHPNDIIPDLEDMLTAQLEEIVERLEKEKKYHKEFECNGANNGKGCYETFCEDQDCRNAPKEHNSTLSSAQAIIKEFISKE